MKKGKDPEHQALLKFEEAAGEHGAKFERFYPKDVHKVPSYDAVLIRADTGGRNMTYAVARMAEAEGIPVLDEADSIAICCNKIHMGRTIQDAGVPVPPTRYLLKSDAKAIDPQDLFDELGLPLVLKAPTSAFSAFVEKVDTPEEYKRVATRFLRLTHGLVVQKFTPTQYDWRVVLVGGRVISVNRYWMPSGAWKVRDIVEKTETTAEGTEETKRVKEWGKVEGVPISQAPKKLLTVAKQGAAAIGTSLYGCDVKQVDDDTFLVIEVNDNPTIMGGYEDQASPRIYDDIVRHLLEGQT